MPNSGMNHIRGLTGIPLDLALATTRPPYTLTAMAPTRMVGQVDRAASTYT